MTDTVPSYLIPGRTPPRPCKYCGETIYLVTIKDGRKSLAVSCLQGKPKTWPPAEGKDGAGVSHSLECTKQNRK